MARLRRRRFLGLLLAAPPVLAGSVAGLFSALAARRAVGAPPKASAKLLEDSDFAYISPLLADGSESSCHAELWYGWIDGAVVVNVASDRWKARAIARGLPTARVWVGDHGRWKSLGGWLANNEAFRDGYHFDARAELAKEDGLIDRLLEIYERKYPAEIASWREAMRKGVSDGSRVLIRYTPIA